MDSGHELPVGGMSEVEGISPVNCKKVFHAFSQSCMVPASSGFDVGSSKLPCFDSFRTKDVSVDLFELVPLKVVAPPVERVCRLAVIEVRKGFLDLSTSGVASPLLSSSSIRLVGAVTGVGLVWPLSERDWQDVAPSLGREGYVVSLKSGERVGAVVDR